MLKKSLILTFMGIASISKLSAGDQPEQGNQQPEQGHQALAQEVPLAQQVTPPPHRTPRCSGAPRKRFKRGHGIAPLALF